MNKLFLLFPVFATVFAFGQSFPPAVGEPGTTAIPKDSSCFVAWANGGTIRRGYIDINDTTATFNAGNRATFGELSYAFGPAEGDPVTVVSLGDSGSVTLTFPQFITDGPGFDFAIFENGFDDNYMELGHVEVSSDGVHFLRFPSISEIPTDVQLSNSGYSDCRYVNNLAGKYRIGYGTPFDLSEVPDDPLLNKLAVTHVRIVDAIGAIAGTGTTDQSGTTINDPYPTPFASGGFDLDGVGIIHATLSLAENTDDARIWPNPTNGELHIALQQPGNLQLFRIDGKIAWQAGNVTTTTIDLNAIGLAPGVYQLGINGVLKKIVFL